MNLALDTAIKALMVNEAAVNVCSNNIANAGTDGYSRQRAIINSDITVNCTDVNKPMGTGATVEDIQRMHDNFLDIQYRNTNSQNSYYSSEYSCLKNIESLTGGLNNNDGNLKAVFNLFWNDMQELSKNPEDKGLRENIKGSAENLCKSFNYLYKNIADIQYQYTQLSEARVTEFNNTLTQLKDLNKKISAAHNNGEGYNDLLDKRDTLLDSLSGLTNITVKKNNDDSITILSSGCTLLSGDYFKKLSVDTSGTMLNLKFNDGTSFNPSQGELGSLIDLVNNKIPDYQDKINTLSIDFMNKFNTIHSSGYGLNGTTGKKFFEGTGAKNMAISDDINNVSNIACSKDGTPGNNEVILDLCNLNSQNIINGGKSSPLDFFDSIVSNLSQETNHCKTEQSNCSVISDSIETKRKSYNGVSLNEETVNMMSYQNAYSTSAKLLQSINSMYDSLLSIFK